MPDRSNTNFMNLIGDLIDKTKKTQIIHFKPLVEGAYKQVRNKIMKIKPYYSPQELLNVSFQDSTKFAVK